MRRFCGWLLAVMCVICVTACNSEEPQKQPATPQFNYLTADLSAYGESDPARLTNLTLTLPAEYKDAEEEERRAALEEVLTAHLCASAKITQLVPQDLAYQKAALVNHFESMRVYDNSIMEQYGDKVDVSPDLYSYLMKAFGFATAEVAEEELTRTAESLAEKNLAVALAFRTLSLTVSEEVRAAVEQDASEMFGSIPQDTAYLDNEAMYRTLMDTLLSPTHCKVIYTESSSE